MDWAAESLQLVLFLEPAVPDPDAFSLWTQALKMRPTFFQQIPDMGGSIASSNVGEYHLFLSVSPLRIEITVAAKQYNQPSDKPPVIYDISPGFLLLDEINSKLSVDYKSSRMALIASLSRFYATQAEAIADFQMNTPTQNIPLSASNLEFVVNVRRFLHLVESQHVEINRLCRWGLGLSQMMQIQAIADGSPQNPSVLKSVSRSTLILDLNTVVADRNYKDASKPETFSNLVSEAEAIIQQGYTRAIS